MPSNRSKSGLAAGTSALIVLLAMSLNIGGLDLVISIVSNFGLLFSIVTLFSFVAGLLFVRFRLRWSVLSGAVIGLISGFGIVFFVVSKI